MKIKFKETLSAPCFNPDRDLVLASPTNGPMTNIPNIDPALKKNKTGLRPVSRLCKNRSLNRVIDIRIVK